MKRTTLWMFAAILICGTVSFLSSCTDSDNATSGIPVNPTDPNIDQMLVKVSVDVPTAVLSSFDEKSMGAAFVRRLPKTTNQIDNDTKMVFIKGEDIIGRPLTEWLETTRLYLRGGYIAIEKPRDAQLVHLMENIAEHVSSAEHDILNRYGNVNIIPANADAAPRRVSSHVERLKNRIANMKLASSRAASEGDPVAEMVIFAIDGYYHHIPYQGTSVNSSYSDNSDVEVAGSTTTVNKEYTKNSSGMMADGAAQWLNNREKSKQASKSHRYSRADGSGAINDLMSASEEYTFQEWLATWSWDAWEARRKQNAYTETMRIWGAHNIDTNKDYYCVEQKVLASVGGKKDGDARFDPQQTLYPGPYSEGEWIEANCDYEGDHMEKYYGAWFQEGNFNMNITGAGEIKLEDAVPDTDNNNVSRSVAVGTSSSNTIGFSFGGLIGESPSLSLGFNYGHTEGSTYTMTTTNNARELRCAKNTEGNKVSWTYTNSQSIISDSDEDEHIMASDAITNDVDIDNQVCWSVANPEGAYTLEYYGEPKMKCLFIKENGNEHGTTTWPNRTPNTQVLLIPNRAEQVWYMDITFPEIGQEGHLGDKGKLVEYLQRQFPSIYQTELRLADQTPESENTIKQLVDYTNEVLNNSDGAQTMKEYALDLGLSQYTVKWYTIDGKHDKYELTIYAK